MDIDIRRGDRCLPPQHPGASLQQSNEAARANPGLGPLLDKNTNTFVRKSIKFHEFSKFAQLPRQKLDTEPEEQQHEQAENQIMHT